MPAFLARRHADPVEVVRRDSVPAQFLWHGRLYVVREVLDHWLRSGAWWQAAALTRLTSGESSIDDERAAADLQLRPLPPSPKWGQRAWGEPAPDLGTTNAGAVGLDDEREFWRVEAAPGRSGARSVVELCHVLASGTWTVTAIHD
jgi:hypothetical protein